MYKAFLISVMAIAFLTTTSMEISAVPKAGSPAYFSGKGLKKGLNKQAVKRERGLFHTDG